MTAETLPSYLCRWARDTACIHLCTMQTHVNTETHIHPSISIHTWFRMSRSIVLRGNLFLFFSHYTLKLLSVIKQTNKKLFWKTLHTPFLSSALKYRLNTHILPVFSYSDSILTCHLILASYFSHVYLPVTCICYLNRKKTFKKRKINCSASLYYIIIIIIIVTFWNTVKFYLLHILYTEVLRLKNTKINFTRFLFCVEE